MSKIYRIYSEAFGEYLEKMAVGLIDGFIRKLSSSGSKGDHAFSYYFHVGWKLTGKFNSDRVYTIEIYDDTTIEQVIKCLNKGYSRFFLPGISNEMHLNISVESCSWDKFNEAYLPVLKIHDSFFMSYHEDAIKKYLRGGAFGTFMLYS